MPGPRAVFGGKRWRNSSLLRLPHHVLQEPRCLTCCCGVSAQMYAVAQTVFGVGVGGEYPIASTSASERAEADEALLHRRGETVMLTFSMQGARRRPRPP